MAKRTKPGKGGRPRSPAPLEVVNFRADHAVREAIDKLTAALDVPGLPPGGARSFAIRRALLAQAAQLDGKGGDR